ncbi:DUF5994 family protein [Streptomyces sp. NPDC054833]
MPARLALRPPTFPPGPGYGACRPRSDDLAAELPALAEVFDTRVGRVGQVAVGRSTRPTAPCDLPVTGHAVRVTWFTSAAAADPALRLTASALLAAEEHRPAEDDVPRRTTRQDAS